MEEIKKQQLFKILDQRTGTTIPNEKRVKDLLSALLSFQFRGYNENLLLQYINEYIAEKQQKLLQQQPIQPRIIPMQSNNQSRLSEQSLNQNQSISSNISAIQNQQNFQQIKMNYPNNPANNNFININNNHINNSNNFIENSNNF